MKVAGKVIATFISILTFVAAGSIAFAQAQAGDHIRDLQELERRISVMEKELKSLSTYVTKRAEVTFGYFQEAERTAGDSRSKIYSLEKRVSELEKQQAVIEELRLRVERLEARILELEAKMLERQRSGMVAEAVRTGSSLRAKNNSSSWQIRRGTAVGELESRIDQLETKMLGLETPQAVPRERKIIKANSQTDSYSGDSGNSGDRGAFRLAGSRRPSKVIRPSYRWEPDAEDSTWAAPIEARPERVRTEVQYYTERDNPQSSSNGRAVAAVIGMLGWWVVMLCANSLR